MMMHPSIFALTVGSLLVTAMMLYTAWFSVQILTGWDLSSGSEAQLDLERKTYLVSTFMTYSFAFQLASLFLFIFTADKLAALFVGAMCAAGSLNVNSYGYPTMALKVVTFLLGGAWLILNHADNKAPDYPMTKKKYLALLFIAPVIIAETISQGAYFLGLKANVITSCCGSLFSLQSGGLPSILGRIPARPMQVTFFAAIAGTEALGAYYYAIAPRGARALTHRPSSEEESGPAHGWSDARGSGESSGGRYCIAGYLFGAASLVTFVLSVAALISFVSLYFYELPTHHCPFCILQKEYGYIGYPLYLMLLAAVVSGTGAGLLVPAARGTNAMRHVPPIQKRLTLVALVCYGLFAATAAARMMSTGFRLGG